MESPSPVVKIPLEYTFTFVLGGLVAVRFWVHRREVKSIAQHASDVLVVLSWVGCFIAIVSYSVEDVEVIRWENGSRDPSTHPVLRGKNHQIHWIEDFIYFIGIWCLKGSLVATYYDVFPEDRLQAPAYKWFMRGLVVYIIITLLAQLLANALYCHPENTIWIDGPAACLPLRSRPIIIMNYVANITTSVIIFALPISVIRTLQINGRFLVAFGFIGVIAIITMAATTVRFAVCYKAIVATPKNRAKSSQQAINEINTTMVWSAVEYWLLMLAVALPPLRVYVRGLTPGLRNIAGSAGRRKSELRLWKQIAKRWEGAKTDEVQFVTDERYDGIDLPVRAYSGSEERGSFGGELERPCSEIGHGLSPHPLIIVRRVSIEIQTMTDTGDSRVGLSESQIGLATSGATAINATHDHHDNDSV